MEGCPPTCEGLKRGRAAKAALLNAGNAGNSAFEADTSTDGADIYDDVNADGVDSVKSEGSCCPVPGSNLFLKHFGVHTTGNCFLDFLVVTIVVTFLMTVLKKIAYYFANRGRRNSQCGCASCRDL